MTNWQEIHSDFTSELQQKWENKGFDYEETKKWINIGLAPEEVELAYWLWDKKGKDVENFVEEQWVKTSLDRLREEFVNDIEESDDEFKSPSEGEINLWEHESNAQQWLSDNYPEEKRESIKELYINEKLEEKLDLSDFTNLEKIYVSYFVEEDGLEIKDKEKYEDKIIKLKNAQEYLEKYLEDNYPGKQKSEIESLNFDNKNLEGELDLSDFTNLTRLDCDNNKLTNLIVGNCSKLKTLWCRFGRLTDLDLTNLTELEKLCCQGNQLSDIKYPLNSKKLVTLNISNNNLEEQDLSIFNQFTNLQSLYIGNDNKEEIEKGKYNCFSGSLETLKNLDKLTELDISNTNILGDLEYLSENVGALKCEVISSESSGEYNFQVIKIKKQLVPCDNSISTWREWNRRGFNSEEIKQWTEEGLKANEYDFASYLRKARKEKGDICELNIKIIEDSREEFNKWIKIAQNYLDNYSEEAKDKIISLNISKKGLEGSLNLESFRNLKELNLANNQITELNLGDCSNIRELYCYSNSLTTLPELPKTLTTLHCYSNELKSLNIRELDKLASLSCNDNLIERLDFGSLNPKKLISLNIKNNNLSEKEKQDIDISIFSEFTKLKQLSIGNDDGEKIKQNKYNRFAGSLKSLKGLTELETLHISNINISEGEIEDLPEKLSVKKFDFSVEERLGDQAKVIQEELYNHLTKQRLNEMYPDKSVTKLTSLYSEGLKGHLDLSEYKNLEELHCYNNKLTSMDVSKNTKLRKLDFSDNKLKEIDLKNNVDLEKLLCKNNVDLEKLDLSKNLNLVYLNCENNNQLIELLGIENCKKLRELKYSKESFEEDYRFFLGRLIEANGVKERWKKVGAQQWLDEEYPKNDKGLGVFDWENKGKLRKDIKELNISGNELSGELKLEGFSGLRYLTCNNNQLTKINLSDCPKLVGIDCRNNELTNLEFNVNCNLVELQASDNKFEKLTFIFSKIEEKISDKYSAQTLSYFNVNNNKISGGKISNFDKFKNLITLNIGAIDKEHNKFEGSLKDLRGLGKLEEIDIRNNGIEIEKFLEGSEGSEMLKKLNKIYYEVSKEDSESSTTEKNDDKKQGSKKSKNWKELNEVLGNYQLSYDEKDNSCCKKSEGQREEIGVTSVIRVPILKVNEESERSKEEIKDYSVDGRLIYPSERAGFNWGTIGELPLSKLPARLYEIDSQRVTDNDLLVEKKEKLNKYLGKSHLEKDFEKEIIEGRTHTELDEVINLLKDVVFLENEEKEKYESYLRTIKRHQEEVHENSIRMRTFENLAEDDEGCIKKWKERNKGKEINSLYEIYDEYLGIEKLIKLTPQQETSKKAVRQEIKKIESYEDWRKRFENSNLSTISFTEDIIDKWRKKGNFDIAGDVKNLLSMMKEKESEFINKLKEKCYIDNLKDLVTQKSPKEVITIIERFKYDQNSCKLEDEISNYYDAEEELSDYQINDYLYKKAIGKIKEEEESSSSLSLSTSGSIKRRIEFINTNGENIAKHYAILSYTWDGEAKEDIKWSPETALKRLSPGGVKSLDKARNTLKVLNDFHLFKNSIKKDGKSSSKVEYLWMDQLCINQDNPREKQHEVPKMREYYGNSTVTLVAIHESVGKETMKRLLNSFERGKSGLIHPSEIVAHSLPILKKIIDSNWFKRSWTYQEGFLSKQTIFMFDDFLIDGRFMALVWKLRQFSEAYYEECSSLEKLCEEKVATPVGWTYYEWGEKRYTLSDQASLRLNEGLWAVKDRGRKYAIDGIYSIVGLLPYGSEVKVNYERDPESVLREVMIIAVEHGHGEPLAWHGSGSKKMGLCWIPEVVANGNSGGSSNVKGSIEVKYGYKKGEKNLELNEKGIKIKGSEYTIDWRDNCIYRAEMGETVDGGLWRRKVWVKKNENSEKGVTLSLSGTKEGVEAADKGRVLIVPNASEWKSKIPFAILVLKIKNDEVEQAYHRLDLVRIEEGYEELIKKDENGEEKSKAEEKELIIGFYNQEVAEQYQTQIEVNPYQK